MWRDKKDAESEKKRQKMRRNLLHFTSISWDKKVRVEEDGMTWIEAEQKQETSYESFDNAIDQMHSPLLPIHSIHSLMKFEERGVWDNGTQKRNKDEYYHVMNLHENKILLIHSLLYHKEGYVDSDSPVSIIIDALGLKVFRSWRVICIFWMNYLTIITCKLEGRKEGWWMNESGSNVLYFFSFPVQCPFPVLFDQTMKEKLIGLSSDNWTSGV